MHYLAAALDDALRLNQLSNGNDGIKVEAASPSRSLLLLARQGRGIEFDYYDVFKRKQHDLVAVPLATMWNAVSEAGGPKQVHAGCCQIILRCKRV